MNTTSNKTAEDFNDIMTLAKKYRALAASLEADKNSSKAAKQWHKIADSLFEAVDSYDAFHTK